MVSVHDPMVLTARDDEVRNPYPYPRARSRWGAIVAGALAGFATTLVMTALGAALGMTAGAAALSRRASDPEAVAVGIGIGVIVWILVTAVVAGIVAGRVMKNFARDVVPYEPTLLATVNWAVGLTLISVLAATGGAGAAGAIAGVGGGAAVAGAGEVGIAHARDRGLDRTSPADTRNDPTAQPLTEAEKAQAAEAAKVAAKAAAKAASTLAWTGLLAAILGLLATIFAARRSENDVQTVTTGPA